MTQVETPHREIVELLRQLRDDYDRANANLTAALDALTTSDEPLAATITAAAIQAGDVVKFPALPEWLRVLRCDDDPISWDLRLTVENVDDPRLGPISIGAHANDRVMRRV